MRFVYKEVIGAFGEHTISSSRAFAVRENVFVVIANKSCNVSKRH
jgi:hypothetical protein